MIYYINNREEEVIITNALPEFLQNIDPYFCIYRDDKTHKSIPLNLAIRDGNKEACDHFIKHLKALRLEDLLRVQKLNIIAWDFLLSDEIISRTIEECDKVIKLCNQLLGTK